MLRSWGRKESDTTERLKWTELVDLRITFINRKNLLTNSPEKEIFSGPRTAESVSPPNLSLDLCVVRGRSSTETQAMGNRTSVPLASPSGCILSHWKLWLHLSDEETTFFFCNTVWPEYQLSDQERWPENGLLSHSTMLQLGLFCERKELA